MCSVPLLWLIFASLSCTTAVALIYFISLNEDLSEEGEASEDGSVSSNDAISKGEKASQSSIAGLEIRSLC